MYTQVCVILLTPTPASSLLTSLKTIKGPSWRKYRTWPKGVKTTTWSMVERVDSFRYPVFHITEGQTCALHTDCEKGKRLFHLRHLKFLLLGQGVWLAGMETAPNKATRPCLEECLEHWLYCTLYYCLLVNISLFSYFSLSLSLCRNGKQIDFLSIDENYNFELQQFISLGSIKTIKQVVPYCLHYHTVCCAQNYLILTMLYATLQGDEIAVECTYSTSNRMTATMVGKYYMTWCYYTCRNTNHRT